MNRKVKRYIIVGLTALGLLGIASSPAFVCDLQNGNLGIGHVTGNPLDLGGGD